MADHRRRILRLSAVLVIVGVLVAVAAVTDVRARTRARNEAASLAHARHELAGAKYADAATTYADAVDTNRRAALQASIAAATAHLATTEQALAFTHADAFLLGLDVGTLQTCLGGVRSSLDANAAGDSAESVRVLAGVSAACSTLADGARAGLVYPFDFPDPDVVRIDGTYYGYGTNSAAGNTGIIESTDLVHWSVVGNALPSLPSWAVPGATWAPGVVQLGSSFALYYSAKVAGPGGGEECISVATATQPQGPFVDTSTAPLECQPALGGSIDPSPYVAADGSAYLEWKSIGGAGQPATIWSEQLDPTGTGFAGGAAAPPSSLIVADQPWEAGVVEAPDLIDAAGRYFLFYSGNNWDSASYAVGVASCAGPLGPCTKPIAQPILSGGPDVQGPGGESIFPDGTGSPWIAFHGYAPGAVGYPNSRGLYLRRLDLSGPTPVVEPAS